jgi:hypothetical protein
MKFRDAGLPDVACELEPVDAQEINAEVDSALGMLDSSTFIEDDCVHGF